MITATKDYGEDVIWVYGYIWVNCDSAVMSEELKRRRKLLTIFDQELVGTKWKFPNVKKKPQA